MHKIGQIEQMTDKRKKGKILESRSDTRAKKECFYFKTFQIFGIFFVFAVECLQKHLNHFNFVPQKIRKFAKGKIPEI